MTKDEFLKLLEKHLEGVASQEETRVLDNFYTHFLEDARGYWSDWDLSEKERVKIEIYSSLSKRVDADQLQELKKQKVLRRRLWGIAASIVLIIGFSFLYYTYQSSETKINYVTKTTQRGQRATISLSDGSVIRLNAESSITYPEKFTSPDTRNVRLTGEAFFEVKRNSEKPFVVTAAQLSTTVLGTSFNIRAYPEDKSISVTVATGRVRVESPPLSWPNANNNADNPAADVSAVVLTKAEQAIFNKQSANISKTAVNLEKYLAWKDGTILLTSVAMTEAAAILGRWYNVEFIFENPAIENCMIGGKFKSDKLVNILENISFLTGIDYRVEPGNKIVLTGKSCN